MEKEMGEGVSELSDSFPYTVEESHVTLNDLKRYREVLLTSESRQYGGGLFYGMDDTEIGIVLRKAQLARVALNHTLYVYGSPARGIPLYVILEGRFLVRKFIQGNMVPSDFYGPGLVFGEAELLARNVKISLRDGRTEMSDITRGQVECIPGDTLTPGRVLVIAPESIVVEDGDFAQVSNPKLATNLARIVSWKLMRIGSQFLDHERLRPRLLILKFLAEKENEYFTSSESLDEQNNEAYTLQLTQAQVAIETHTKTSTVNNIFKGFLAGKNVTYKDGQIAVPRRGYLQAILNDENISSKGKQV